MCAFVVLLILYGAMLGIVRTEWFHHLLLRRIAEAIENATGARVEIARLDLRSATLQVTLLGLVLHGTELAPQPPLFSAPVIVVGLNPASLVRRRLLLRSFASQGATIHIYTHPDGSTNIPRPRAAGSGSSAIDDFIDIAVHRLNVVGTSFFWNDRRVPLDLSARDIALTLSFRSPSSYVGSLSSLALQVTHRGTQIPALTFSTRLTLSHDQLALTSLVWRSSGLAGRAAIRARLAPTLAGQLSLEGSGELREVARALKFPDVSGGSIRWTTEAAYESGHYEAHGHFDLRHLTVATPSAKPGPFDASADYSMDRQGIELSRVTAELLDGRVLGTARADFGGAVPHFRVQAQIEGLDLARVLDSASGGKAVLGELPVAARINGNLNASWKGSLHDFASHFAVAFEPSKEPARAGALPVTGFARGTIALLKSQPSITVENANLRTPHSSISVQGALGGTTSNLAVQFETSDFEEWRAISESFAETPLPVLLRSTATFAGTVTGSVTRPEIRGRFSLGAFNYRNWRWDHFGAIIDATSDHVAISSGQLVGGSSDFTFSASAGLDHWQLVKNAPIQLSAEARATPLQGLENALGLSYPLNGRLTGEIQVNGTRQDLAGGVRLRIDQGAIENQPFDSLNLQAQVAGSVWNVETIELAKDNGRITGQMRIDIPRRDFSVQSRGVNLSLVDFGALQHLGLPSQGSGPPTKGGLEGQLDFDLRGHGAFDHPQIHSTLQASELQLDGNALGGFQGTLDWSADQLRVDGSLQGDDGELRLAGQARTTGDWPADLTVEYAKLRADPWIRSLRLERFGAQVTVSGSTRLSGPLREPARLQVVSQNPELAVSFPGMAWKNDQPVRVTLADRVLTVDRFQLSGPSTRFEIEGSVHLAEPRTLALTAQGQVDAALLTALDPTLVTGGKFDVELRARGITTSPLLYGVVTVDGVSLGYPGFPLRVSGLTGQIHLEGDRFTIASLKGTTGQSSVGISGFVSVAGTPHYDVRATLDRARVEYPVDFTSLLSGNVHLTGSTQGGTLNGYLTVQQMFVSPDFNIADWIGEMANSPPAEPGAPSSFASKVRLNLHVVTEPTVGVESHDLTMTTGIDLTLRGTAADPVAFGTIHILNGQVALRGSKYTLTRGDITMSNPVRTQAVLDIEARTRVQRYDLTLTVTGPAESPRISYRSEPPLSTPDILSLLAFGYSRQEEQLTSGTGPSTFGTLGASALLSQALSSQFSSRIQRLFGLGRISIDPNPGGAGGTRVTVEERPARNFTVTYVNTTGGLQQRIVQVEWDLSDRVSLLGVRDQNGVFGLELDFRHHFK